MLQLQLLATEFSVTQSEKLTSPPSICLC